MIEHTLGECLTTSRSTKLTVEAEGLHDGEVSLDCEHRGTRPLLLAEDLSTTLVQHAVNTTDSVLRALNFD